MAQNNKSNKNKQQTKQNVAAKKNGQPKKREASSECKSSSCCKWLFGSFVLIVVIAAVLAYDTSVNGKGVFAKSAVGKVLKDAGMLPYVEKAWYNSMSAAARGYKWAEVTVPPYAKPAFELICDLFKLARTVAYNACTAISEFVRQKLPIAGDFLEQYVPGLPKKIEDFSVSAKNIFVGFFEKTVEFFKTQVLVGHLSPENLNRALNQTQNTAVQYFNLFHQKVDTYAKLKWV